MSPGKLTNCLRLANKVCPFLLTSVGHKGSDRRWLDSNFARDAFSTFIPISVESDARTKIIFDFFDLLAAIAAHAKSNGLGGRKLSRYAGWWAFEHTDTGNGFEASYKNWATWVAIFLASMIFANAKGNRAADATSHLFFAYLRSISPDSVRGVNGISSLPIALQSLVQATEYPPETPTLLQVSTTKVVMIVENVSPTPFALLRRAKNFEYRDSDRHLQEFAALDDPVCALTDECQRVLLAISNVNQSSPLTSKATAGREISWSRFEDLGFGAELDLDYDQDLTLPKTTPLQELRSAPETRSNDWERPTTPSWADFLSSGFPDESGPRGPPSLLLPPDKVLPPVVAVRGKSSQSHKRNLETESTLEPGELASITTMDLDDSFWWVWISSLAGEETAARKAVFGRCALVETIIAGAKWLILEEQVKGAAPEPEPGAYIAEKKRFFGFGSRRKLSRRKSSSKKSQTEEVYKSKSATTPSSRTSIGPDQHARIQAAAAALQKKQREQEEEQRKDANSERRGRSEEEQAKTNSVMTMQTSILTEATQAMKWARDYDKDAVRAAYLSDSRAGTGAPAETLNIPGVRPSATEAQETSAEEKSSAPAAPANDAPAAKTESTPVTEKETASTVAPSSEPEGKKSFESSEDPKKIKKKPGANTTFKSIFNSTKKRDNPPSSKVNIDPSAVAAARAALENKVKAQDAPKTPPSSHRKTTLKKKGPGESPAQEKTTASAAQEVQQQPTPEPEEARTPTAAEPVATSPVYNGPPRTSRDADFDALSRVDTQERAMADKEFSSFDQGQYTETPAYVPAEPVSPVSSVSPASEAGRPTSQTEEERPALSAYDRLAQLRKNAAERAAAAEEVPSRASQADRTDDGDTSGEESEYPNVHPGIINAC